MNPEELTQINKVIHQALDERDSLDKFAHREHHAFINELIEERQERKERWEKVKQQTIAWFVISTLSGIGIAVYNFLFRSHQ